MHSKFSPNELGTWAPIHQVDGRLNEISRKIWKFSRLGLNISNRSDIWQAARQHHCRDACQNPELYSHHDVQSRGFETSLDLAVRRPPA